jgi:hypothetical protein
MRAKPLKIFDKEVVKYLESVKVSDKEIASIKFRELKEKVLLRINHIHLLINKDDYDAVMEMTAHSSSGDGYGDTNNYIDFGDIIGNDSLDIKEVCEMLKMLRSEK